MVNFKLFHPFGSSMPITLLKLFNEDYGYIKTIEELRYF